MLQMDLQTDFDVRCRTPKIPDDNSAEAVAAYKDAAAQGRTLGLRSALRRMPGSFTTAGTAKEGAVGSQPVFYRDPPCRPRTVIWPE
ncbi:hypothetical protein E4U13_006310 [Claviceps humidiphila]|uniref:Uncharacterized protein n=1 Tax=Claviceps humidiphila TaxID=1294629 RepID=A0A9P7PZC4_9HYPO|nr:hypothetical protein E4U13_006310 [Claviceps humidiphila]